VSPCNGFVGVVGYRELRVYVVEDLVECRDEVKPFKKYNMRTTKNMIKTFEWIDQKVGRYS